MLSNGSIFCFAKLDNFLEKETGEDYIIKRKNSNQGINQDFSEQVLTFENLRNIQIILKGRKSKGRKE